MYDAFTSSYSLACPQGPSVRVPPSSFRSLARVPATSHPAVYAVAFACSCGDERQGLVAHAELDRAHLGTTVELTRRLGVELGSELPAERFDERRLDLAL